MMIISLLPPVFDTARFALRGELVAGHESQSSLTVGLGAVDGI